MVRKIQAKLVLRLHAQGLSGRAIARSQGMSRRSVSDVLDAARAVGVGWDDVAGKTDGGCTPCCFPVGVSAKACTSSPTGPGFIASWRAWA